MRREAWVAWTRILLQSATDGTWPERVDNSKLGASRLAGMALPRRQRSKVLRSRALSAQGSRHAAALIGHFPAPIGATEFCAGLPRRDGRADVLQGALGSTAKFSL